MRAALLLAACLLGGCPSRSTETVSLPDEDGNDLQGECRSDDDCTTAATTCCECPAFAVGADDPRNHACGNVQCPIDRVCPDNVRATCSDGTCTLACNTLSCTPEQTTGLHTCQAGFAIDATGCLSCACAGTADVASCTMDSDCVPTRADCCGCARGGEDTAVLGAQRAAFDANLGCSDDVVCPEVYVCDADATARCISGECELVVGGLVPGACGRADLPPCPPDQACVVNADPQASEHGVGVCMGI